jgi:cytochrome c nitrite reductase small subunit
VVALVAGFGGFTFFQAKGHSYLVDDPQACVNCHIMRDQYEGWQHSNHRRVASCNGCHTPKNFVGKWATKAINGWNHSAAFTTGNFPEPIRIKQWNLDIAEANCMSCHDTVASHMRVPSREVGDVNCTRCHQNVGH